MVIMNSAFPDFITMTLLFSNHYIWYWV